VVGPRIAIIIPALNEARTIGKVVELASRAGTAIVVDDGSRDETGSIASQAGAEVVRHPACRGYDRALNSGFERANQLGYDFAVTMDADGQHDGTLVGKFVQALSDGADLVVGVRDRRQRFAEHVFAWVGRIKWKIRDPLCGMKGYRLELFRELGHFDSYDSIGTELAIYAAKRGKKIVQIPIVTRDRLDQARFGRRFSANKRILHALWVGLATHG
jgi:glycosyltransferase involved in cell wall biosynthesis